MATKSQEADYIVEGDVPAGSAPLANPVNVGVFDGTNVQRLSGDTSGNVNTNASVQNSAITLCASFTDAVAGANKTKAAVTGLGKYKQIQILLNVTSAGAAAGDTLDVFVDTSPDSGTTWVNTIHFNQVLGNGGAVAFWATLDPAGAAGTSSTNVTADAAAAAVRPSMFTDRLRVRYTIVDGGAHGQSFTFSVLGFAKA